MTEEKFPKKWRFDFIGGSEETLGGTEQLGENSFFPLSNTKVGDRVWITGLRSTQDLKSLLKMGLQPGNELEIVGYSSGGSIVVSFQGNRIGLSLNIARHIIVTDNSTLIQDS